MADPYQALYRRYRSKRFGEQRGQDHVMRALRTAVQEDRVGHAYLFSGPRGTGKTSTARILAKVLNCDNPADGEPCGVCPNCVAVDEGRIVDWLLELDAASNNGVANIRDLIDRIPLGTSGNRKVVILDEVHMLSAGASNALLKSLEEPPAHVVFILATTDPQKVLPTIRSRTQHFEFHLLPAEEMADHVRGIIADAGLGLGEDAIDHVVRQGGGSARDTLSALDQVAAMGGVVHESQPVEAILEALCEADAGAALVAVAEATATGRDPRALGETLISRLRDAFLAVMGAPDRHLPAADAERASAVGQRLGAAGLTRALEVLGEALVELAKKPDPRIVLEVALVRLCRPDADRSLDAVLDRIDRLERSLASGPTAGTGGPSAATTADAAPPQSPSGVAAAPAHRTPSESAPEPAAPGAPAGAAAEPAAPAPPRRPAGPAAEAREQLAKVTAAPAPPSRVRAAVKKAAPAPAAAPARVEPSSPDPSPPAATSPAATAPTPSSDGPAGDGVPSEAELADAWSTAVLPALKPGTRAVFGTGRFVASSPESAVFALQNAPTRDHCEKRRSEVEEALASHFGRPVPLRLVTDADVGGSPAVGAPTAPAAPQHEDEIDVTDLEDAPDVGSGVDRLAQAFPGAELVEEP
jgi:DNA polymerase-3 subunit gamma/tau